MFQNILPISYLHDVLVLVVPDDVHELLLRGELGVLQDPEEHLGRLLSGQRSGSQLLLQSRDQVLELKQRTSVFTCCTLQVTTNKC